MILQNVGLKTEHPKLNKESQTMNKNNSFLSVKNSVRLYNRLCAKISVAIMKRRVEMKKTQKDFSKYMDVSQGMVSRWESGEYNFTIDSLAKIFDTLEMDIDIKIIPRNAKKVIPYNKVKIHTDSENTKPIVSKNQLAELMSKAG